MCVRIKEVTPSIALTDKAIDFLYLTNNTDLCFAKHIELTMSLTVTGSGQGSLSRNRS